MFNLSYEDILFAAKVFVVGIEHLKRSAVLIAKEINVTTAALTVQCIPEDVYSLGGQACSDTMELTGAVWEEKSDMFTHYPFPNGS